MRVGVLVNANARQHQRRPALVESYRATAHAIAVTSRASDVDGAVASLQDAGVNVVAISGGDGAVHHGVSAIIRGWQGPLPRIAILPAGTMNTVARGLGVRGGPLARLRACGDPDVRLLERCPIDAGEGRYGFLVGTGFWARFLRAYDQRTGPGAMRAASVLARGLASTAVGGPFVRDLFEAHEADVYVNGAPFASGAFTMLAAGAVPQVGLGFSPFRGVLQTPDRFHALAFVSAPSRVALQLPRLFLGRDPSAPDWGGPATDVTVSSRTPLDWAIDGEVQQSASEIRLSCGPALSLCVS